MQSGRKPYPGDKSFDGKVLTLTEARKRNETYGIKVGAYRDASPLGFSCLRAVGVLSRQGLYIETSGL